jgi:hypothetical protein
MASLEGDNQLVFYYLRAFEIWPHKMGDLSFNGLIVLVASVERDNLLVFYYPRAFEILPYKMGGLRWLIILFSQERYVAIL